MADQVERVILTAEDETKRPTASANKNIEGVEKKAVEASAAITATTATAGQKIVTITDRSLKEINRLVDQQEKKAAAAGANAIERLEAERAAVLRNVRGNTEAVNRVNAAIDKRIVVEQRAMSATAAAAAAADKASMRQVSATRNAADSVDRYRTATERARASTEQLGASRSLSIVERNADRAEGAMNRFARRTREAAGLFSSFGQSLTIGVTGPIALAANAALDLVARYDSIDKSFTAILGNETLSRLQQAELRGSSREPGLTYEGATGGFRRIAAARRDVQLATSAIKEFGNALALAGGTEEDLAGVTLALTQLLSKARVSAEEINQIAERIPQTRTLISKAFGTSDSEAIVKKGIDPETFVRGVIEQAKLLPRAAVSIQSELKNVREDFRQTMAIVGKDLADVLLPIAKSVSTGIRDMAIAFSEFPQSVRRGIVVMTLLAATLGPVALAIGGVYRVVSTLAQGYTLATAALARSTAVQTANTVATVAQATAYDRLAVAAGRAGTAEVFAGIPNLRTGVSAGAARQAEATADILAAQSAARAKLLARAKAKETGGLFAYTAVAGRGLGRGETAAAEAQMAKAAPRVAALVGMSEAAQVRMIAAARAAAGFGTEIAQASTAMNTLRVAGLAFLALPLIGVIQGIGQSIDRAFNRAKPQWVDDVGGTGKVLVAAGRDIIEFAQSLAAPALRTFGEAAGSVGGVISDMTKKYQEFVDLVSRKVDDSGLLSWINGIVDAGKRRLTGEKLAEDSLKRQQGFAAKSMRDQAIAAGALEKRGEKEAAASAEAAKIAERRAELTRDLRMELVKSTQEALRAGKTISEVERVAADRAQERQNMIEKEGAAVGRLQRRLFDLATTQKILEADRKENFAALEEATRFRDAATQKELTGLQRVAEQRRQAIADLDKRSVSGGTRAQALGLIDAGTAALTKKVHDQNLAESQTFFDSSARVAAEGYDRIEEQRREWLAKVAETPAAIAKINDAILLLEQRLTRDLEAELAERRDQRTLKSLDAGKETALRSIELRQARELEIETTFGRENLARRIRTEQEKLAVEEEFARRRLAVEETLIQRRGAIAEADAQSEKQKEAIRKKTGSEIEDIRQQSQIDLDRERVSTAIRLEELVRAENQKTFDRFKSAYDDLFDAIVSRTKSVGDVVKGILKSVFLTPIKEVTGNIFAGAATRIFGIPTTGGTRGLSTKLDLPGRLGDVVLQGKAVPVVIQNLPGAPGGGSGASAATSGGMLANLGALASIGTFGGFGGFRTPPFVPGGSVSSSIDFGGGPVDLGGRTYGGTPPFVPGASGGGGFGGLFGGMKDILTKLGGLGRGPGVYGPGSSGGSLAGHGFGGATGGAMLLGGASLAIDGLRRGGWKGLGETAAGGALIGLKFGGPIGALIGGAVGAAAGGIRMLFKTKNEGIISKIQQIYGVKIDGGFAKNPIGQIVSERYGGNMDVGLSSPEVRDLVNQYARATGQEYGLANRPFAVGIQQSGGTIAQTAARVDGLNVAYSGGSIGTTGPVDRLVTSTVPNSLGMAPTIRVDSLQLLVNGAGAADALSGSVARNPQAVATANLQAQKQSINRRELTALQLTPGVIT